MTIDEFLDELRRIPGVVLHPGADEADLVALEQRYGIRLSAPHRELLAKTNGVEAAGGYLRLFGVGASASIDMGWWNDPELWKFASDPKIRELFCIGEDGWGNQLVQRFDDLTSGHQDPPVYFFPSETQNLGRLAISTTAYLERGFLSNSAGLKSVKAVRKRLGDLEPGEHVVHSPPDLITGEESVHNVMKMPAVMSMIINGDVWAEYQRVSDNLRRFDFRIVAMEPWVDDKGRPRMRLLSEDDGGGG